MRITDLTYLDSVDPIDWARLAAFVDGEGCLMLSSSKTQADIGNRRVGVTISNTNPMLMNWLASVFGGSICNVRACNQRSKPSFMWTISSRRAERVIHGILPYLLLKTEQAKLLLEYRKCMNFGRNQTYRLTAEDLAIRQGLADRLHGLNKRGVSIQ